MYKTGHQYSIVYADTTGEQKETKYTPEKDVTIAGLINGIKAENSDFLKLMKVTESKERSFQDESEWQKLTDERTLIKLKDLDNYLNAYAGAIEDKDDAEIKYNYSQVLNLIGYLVPALNIKGGAKGLVEYIKTNKFDFENRLENNADLLARVANDYSAIYESKKIESASDRYQVREFEGPGASFGVYDTKNKKFVQKGSKKVMIAACNDLNKKLTEAVSEEEVDETLIAIDNATDMDELQDIIYHISDGVLEDELQSMYDACVEDGNDLDEVKSLLSTIYEDNVELEEPLAENKDIVATKDAVVTEDAHESAKAHNNYIEKCAKFWQDSMWDEQISDLHSVAERVKEIQETIESGVADKEENVAEVTIKNICLDLENVVSRLYDVANIIEDNSAKDWDSERMEESKKVESLDEWHIETLADLIEVLHTETGDGLDVTDDDIDMTTYYDYDEMSEDAYDKCLQLIAAGVKVISVQDKDFAVVDFYSYVKDHLQAFLDHFYVDSSEDEDEAIGDIVEYVIPGLAAGNTNDSTYESLYNALQSKSTGVKSEAKESHKYEIKFNDGAVQRHRTPNNTVEITGTRDDVMQWMADNYVDNVYDLDADEDVLNDFNAWVETYEEDYDPSGSNVIIRIKEDGNIIYENEMSEEFDEMDAD